MLYLLFHLLNIEKRNTYTRAYAYEMDNDAKLITLNYNYNAGTSFKFRYYCYINKLRAKHIPHTSCVCHSVAITGNFTYLCMSIFSIKYLNALNVSLSSGYGLHAYVYAYAESFDKGLSKCWSIN